MKSLRFWILVAILIHLILTLLWQGDPFANSVMVDQPKPEEKRITFDLQQPQKELNRIYDISTPPVEEISDLPPAETVSPTPSPKPKEAASQAKPTKTSNPKPVDERPQDQISKNTWQSKPYESPPLHLPKNFVLKEHDNPNDYQRSDAKEHQKPSNDAASVDQPSSPNVVSEDDGGGDHWETVGGAAFDVTDFTGFEEYARIVKERVRRRWYAPYAFTHLGSMSGDCMVEFRIEKNGAITGLKLLDSSGYKALDDPAVRAIEFAAPFPQLPSDFPEDALGVRFEFSYILLGK